METTWTDTEIAFAKHRHEWLHLKDIPADDPDLPTARWWAVVRAYNDGDDFGGAIPGDGKPRFVAGWTRSQIDAREAECLKLAPLSPAKPLPASDTKGE